jgi:competence protein ComFC
MAQEHYQHPEKHSEARRYGLFSYLIDLIFPRTCLHCKRVDTAWCQNCLEELEQSSLQPQIRSLYSLDDTLALAPHTGIFQHAIQALKYHQATYLTPILGTMLVKTLVSHTTWTFDMIIPVPMHPTRLQKRGYNQSKLLSDILHQQLNSPIQENALKRIRDTRTQVELSGAERLQNLNDAFEANRLQVENKAILLVDDVMTTGTTLIQCAQSLRTNGASNIFAITVTYAVVH